MKPVRVVKHRKKPAKKATEVKLRVGVGSRVFGGLEADFEVKREKDTRPAHEKAEQDEGQSGSDETR